MFHYSGEVKVGQLVHLTKAANSAERHRKKHFQSYWRSLEGFTDKVLLEIKIDVLSHRQLQSCHRHRCHQPGEKPSSQHQTELWQWQRSSAGTSWSRKSGTAFQFYGERQVSNIVYIQFGHKFQTAPFSKQTDGIILNSSGRCDRWFLLQLIFLNVATLVLVNDGKGLLDVITGFTSQADLGEEFLVVERVGSCEETQTRSHTCSSMVE